jgi:hypothetical protein
MSRNHRQHLIDRAVIRALLQCGAYACPDAALYETVVLVVTPCPLRSEFEGALRHLETERRVVGIRGETGAKWKITEEGQLWAAEQSIS